MIPANDNMTLERRLLQCQIEREFILKASPQFQQTTAQKIAYEFMPTLARRIKRFLCA